MAEKMKPFVVSFRMAVGLLSGIAAGLFLSASGQERPSITARQFIDRDASYRQNFCTQAELVANRTIKLRDAVRGHELRPGIFIEEYLELDYNGDADGVFNATINKEYPGLLGVLLDELGERAGFTWRNSFGVTTDPVPFFNNTGQFSESESLKAFAELLEWTATTFDFAADWWPPLMQFMDRGITFQAPWYDADIIMVMSRNQETSEEFSAISWLLPFEPLVWVVTIMTIVISAMIYQCLEKINQGTDDNDLENDFGWNIFLSAITFTGHFSYHPRTNEARLFTVSLTLIALLLASAYTANLASFLVVRSMPTIVINTLDDVVRHRGKVCVSSLTNAGEVVSQRTLDVGLVNVVVKDSEAEMFQGVVSGECLIAATTAVSWRLHENDETANPGCVLKRTGFIVKQFPASFGYIADAGQKCTTLVRDALNIHMAEMNADGFIERAWRYEISRRATFTECASTGTTTAGTTSAFVEPLESERLGLIDVGGIFIAHYLFAGITITIALIKKCLERKREMVDIANQGRISNNMESSDLELFQHGAHDDAAFEAIISFVKDVQMKNKKNMKHGRSEQNETEEFVADANFPSPHSDFDDMEKQKNLNVEEELSPPKQKAFVIERRISDGLSPANPPQRPPRRLVEELEHQERWMDNKETLRTKWY